MTRSRPPALALSTAALTLLGCSGAIGDGAAPPGAAGVPGPSNVANPTQPAPAPGAAPSGGNAVDGAALFACQGPRPASPARIWRLTAAQFDSSVRALSPMLSKDRPTNPFDGAESTLRFKNYAESFGMPGPVFDRTLTSTEQIAARVAGVLQAELPCLASPDAGCARALFTRLGPRAFRRPLAADEADRYTSLVTGLQPTVGWPAAIRYGVQAMLSSPYFLFRVEIGEPTPDATGRRRLGAYEVAAALSYTLTDAPPDDALTAAAAQGALATPADVRKQVTRLLGDPSQSATVQRFFREYLRYDGTLDVFKDPKLYPWHSPAALLADTDLWIKDVVAARKDLVPTLLTAPWGYVGPKSATNYGVATAPKAEQRVAFPAGQRAGILTQPAFLTSFSDNDANDPIRRGKFIAQSLLCEALPDTPPDNVPPLPDNPRATLRERLQVHRTSVPTCRACHDIMDSAGLGLEGYDHLGRVRTIDGDQPADAHGAVVGTGTALDGPFDGAVELAARLGASPVTEQCVVRHSFRFLFGRNELASDACTFAAAADAWKKAGGDYAEVVTSLLASDSFLYRSNP